MRSVAPRIFRPGMRLQVSLTIHLTTGYGVLHVGDGRCNTAYGESGKYDHEAQNERWQQRLCLMETGAGLADITNPFGLYQPGCVLHTRYLIQIDKRNSLP